MQPVPVYGHWEDDDAPQANYDEEQFPHEQQHQYQAQQQAYPPEPASELSEDPLLLHTPDGTPIKLSGLKVKLDLRKAAHSTPTQAAQQGRMVSRGRQQLPSSEEEEYKEEDGSDLLDGDAEGELEVPEQVEEQVVQFMDEPRYPKRSTRNSNGSNSSKEAPPPPAQVSRPKKRFRVEDDDEEDDSFAPPKVVEQTTTTTLHGRRISRPVTYAEEPSEEDDEEPVRGAGSRRVHRGSPNGRRSKPRGNDFMVVDEAEEERLVDDEEYGQPRRSLRSSTRQASHPAEPPTKKRRTVANQPLTQRSMPKPRTTRNSRRSSGSEEFDPEAVTSNESDDILPPEEMEVDLREEEEEEEPPEAEPKQYSFRERKSRPNYTLPALLTNEEIERQRKEAAAEKAAKKAKRAPKMNWNMTGKDLGRLLGEPEPDSDDDVGNTPAKRGLFGTGVGAGLQGAGAGGVIGGSMFADGAGVGGVAGTPSHLGKIGGQDGTADADPLGVDLNVTFEQVGGLDNHIQRLKDMVFLPLQYPEMFEHKNITPPKGVLFYGPPGTGKTLVARALAASCSTGNQKIAFFMRKGADVLSKWVGEAERQLRLLFEEARACQPAIIFFDEIDGLAPVRSSRQDQIHASIVSTLLSLMDGMDSRGQVIVIGATNRPDAVDPALRRPGRFDREFYFPLPTLDARKKIIEINTAKWNPPLEDKFTQHLAELTKGYGGADLRALCTEAAMNAIQRTYPQIYKSKDRLVIQPDNVKVAAKDFMIALKMVVPSSERSTSSAAVPLPEQLKPLLEDAVDRTKAALDRALPPTKQKSVLEEAEWEEEDGGFEQEVKLKAMDTLRVYRPRVLIHGPPGMGQNFVAAAALHYLEGYNVQSLDLGTLMSDSSRTPEAAVAQLFTEAKRHKPSILYIPGLVEWANAVSPTTRATLKSCLDGLSPSDPVLLLAIVEGPLRDVPADVRSWFGVAIDNRIRLDKPTEDQRNAFFAELLKTIETPPNKFGDAMPRKKRVLEELPIAAPLPPRQPTAAELAAQRANDQRTRDNLRWKLSTILNELKRKYRRFWKSVVDEYGLPDNYFEQPEELEPQPPAPQAPSPSPPQPAQITDGASQENAIEVDGEAAPPQILVNGDAAHLPTSPTPAPAAPVVAPSIPPSPPRVRFPRLFDVSGDVMHEKVFHNVYLTPSDFLLDIERMLYNAELADKLGTRDRDRLEKAREMMLTAKALLGNYCDDTFITECLRMATREKQRLAEAAEKAEAERAEKDKKNGKSKAVNGNGNGFGFGVRSSARVNGLQPEFGMTDLAAFEKNKRKRGSSAEKSDSQSGGDAQDQDGEERGRKRVKILHPTEDASEPPFVTPHHEGDMSLDSQPPITLPTPMIEDVFTAPPADPATIPLFSHAIAHGALPPAELLPQTPAESDSVLASGGPIYPVPTAVPTVALPSIPPTVDMMDVVNTSAVSSIPDAIVPASEPAEPAEPREPSRESTPVPPPVFTLDATLFQVLKDQFIHSTADLNVEELEQLRALSLDKVYRARAEWDRDPVVQSLVGFVRAFVAEVNGEYDD
ncbi:AAA-domain-containing protein [Calocera cornea HHB12733]|uniref:AAA-domain-containing protein n=1 Tax=Calocera cornea HHB12733 TaxID=1353952 RepID=A0A165D0U5_9BASI|nr:AAA-domain-containing protein [Calocera cornea HHB12733]